MTDRTHAVIAVAAGGVPDPTVIPVSTMYGMLSGTGVLVMVGVALVAWWINRHGAADELAWLSAGGAGFGVATSTSLSQVERVEAARELAALRAAALVAEAAANAARARDEAAADALHAAESAHSAVPVEASARRQETQRLYDAALAEVRAARQAGYVAETAAQALRTEARLAAAELSGRHVVSEDLSRRVH
jgi:hypothetical protein